jgi:hypothetical protein
VTLGVHQFLEKRRKAAAAPAYRPRIKIYREADCRVSNAMLDEMKKIEASLIQQAKEHKWEVDWATHERQRTQAEEHQGEGRLGNAYRDLCRAMRPLFAALDRSRHKEEAFQPNYEKKKR